MKKELSWWMPDPSLPMEAGKTGPNSLFHCHDFEKVGMVMQWGRPIVYATSYNLNQSVSYPHRLLVHRKDTIVVLVNHARDRANVHFWNDSLAGSRSNQEQCFSCLCIRETSRKVGLGSAQEIVAMAWRSVLDSCFGVDRRRGAVTVNEIASVIRSAGIEHFSGGDLGYPTIDYVCYADIDAIRKARIALNIKSPRAMHVRLPLISRIE